MVAKIKQAFPKVKRTGSPCHALLLSAAIRPAFSVTRYPPVDPTCVILQSSGKPPTWKEVIPSKDGKKKNLQAVDHGSTEFTRNQGGSKALTCFPPAGRRRSPSSSVWLNTRDPWRSPINPDDGVTLTNNKFKLYNLIHTIVLILRQPLLQPIKHLYVMVHQCTCTGRNRS